MMTPSRALSAALLLFVWVCGGACQSAPHTRAHAIAWLRLEVQPADAALYVDESYQGVATGWRDQRVPLRAGARLIELRAPGYIPHRFELSFAPQEEITLSVKLLPTLDPLPPDDPALD